MEIETQYINNQIIDDKIEGIKLCLHCLQHKKSINTLIDELLEQKTISVLVE